MWSSGESQAPVRSYSSQRCCFVEFPHQWLFPDGSCLGSTQSVRQNASEKRCFLVHDGFWVCKSTAGCRDIGCFQTYVP
ncbi:hypothetical protein LINPERHAP1_LOCUS15646 [Linum perenne]